VLAAILKSTAREESILGPLLVLGAIACLGCALVAFVLNLKLVWQIVRGRLRFRRMGLSEESGALWKAHQRRRRWAALGEKLFLTAGCLAVLFGLIWLAIAWKGHKSYLLTVFGCGLGLLLLMFYFLRSGKARLDMMSARLEELRRLKESMTELATSTGQAGDGQVELPADLVEKYSQVETDQIARNRAQAIRDALQAKTQGYAMLSSHQVRETKLGLSLSERSQVEETLAALMDDPWPKAAVQEADKGVLRLPVEGTGLEIFYSVDKSSLQVRVVALQTANLGSASNA
jgi:hypothetical protein